MVVRKFLLPVVFLLIFFLLIPSRALAEEKFETRQTVNYAVFDNGLTSVTEKVVLKNKTDEFRPSQYSLELGFTDVRNIQISDSDGSITPKIEKQDKKTTIEFVFNSIVVGKDRELPFTISYETAELAKKKGALWEVSIPGIADSSNLSEYIVNLSVPEKFGEPTYVKPNKSLVARRLSWTKEEIPKGGMIVSFGQFQIYKFNLTYHLKNPRLYPIQTEIALPPDTNYQKVFINELTPKPVDVFPDKDGNWLARYKINPASEITVQAQGLAQVFLVPQSSQELSEIDEKNYLSSQKYWLTEDKTIADTAQFLKIPLNIYNYVVSELKYDYSRVEKGLDRMGGAQVLKNKNSAICMEFTDLFIALSRSAKIPTREVNGFAFTEDSSFRPLSLVRDILHAWPEYYDREKQTWIMVDPTWGNTTGGLDYFNIFDFDHLAFVIKGIDSQYPIPAGGYKTEKSKDAKDVQVELGEAIDLKTNVDMDIKLTFPKQVLPFFPIQGELQIKNSGNVMLPSRTITVSQIGAKTASQLYNIEQIPPFGQIKVPVVFKGYSLFEKRNVIIRAQDQLKQSEVEVVISPLAITDDARFMLGGSVFVAGIFAYITIRVWRLYLSRRKGEYSVRGQSQQRPGSSSHPPKK